MQRELQVSGFFARCRVAHCKPLLEDSVAIDDGRSATQEEIRTMLQTFRSVYTAPASMADLFRYTAMAEHGWKDIAEASQIFLLRA